MSKILVELQDWMGNDRAIANAAWTSSLNKENRESKTDEQVEKLVKFLAKEKHSTPFESVVLRFWIRMPIFTDRQHMTHRIASHNGLSGRYRTMPTDYYSIPEDVKNILNKGDIKGLEQVYNLSCLTSIGNYKQSIELLKESEKSGFINNDEYKRVREILRGQLPVSGFTERTTIMNLRSFANYQKLRNKANAQKEIQIVAELMLKEVINSNVCPIAINALMNNNWEI